MSTEPPDGADDGKLPQPNIEPSVSEMDGGSIAKETFNNLWIEFYNKASSFTAVEKSSVQNKKQILNVLDTFQKMIFGVDENSKRFAVNHGNGGLELILNLTRNRIDADLMVAALKALKCCVIGNRAGKMRCRHAGVFEYITLVLKEGCKDENELIAEEAVTTFAAMCMGETLNAVQGSVEQKVLIEVIKSVHPSPKIIKMCTYLLALFVTCRSEVPPQISEENLQLIFGALKEAEKFKVDGEIALLNLQYGFAEGKFTKSLNLLVREKRKFYIPAIKVIIADLYSSRAVCRLETGYQESALSDAEESLRFFDENRQASLLKGNILKALGRNQEGKTELEKGFPNE